MKHLCGQGKLYVRLNVSKDILVGGEETDEEPENEEAASNASPTPPIINITDYQEQSTSAGSSFFDESLVSLSAIFPEDVDTVRDALIRYEDLELAAQALSEKAEMVSSGAESGDESVTEVLKRLKA